MAVLLPLTGARADIGQVLLQAVQLALPDGAGPTLDVLDTGGTAAGAVPAAQAAVSHGDGLILGPLTSAETAAVAPIAKAASVPVLALTNDTSQAGPGVWTLGISPDQQVQRLVAAAHAQNKDQVAALLPDSDFGRAMANALTKEAQDQGLSAPTIQMHPPGMAAITAAIRELSDYADRRGPLDQKIKAARALGTAEGRRQAQELAKQPIPPAPFNVLLLADTGDNLQEIAAVLPYYDVDRSAAQIIGPALWADPSSGSGAMSGAWYAAPDPAQRANFARDYASRYNTDPPPIADLAYDAAQIARAVLGPGGVNVPALTQPGGFAGSDGTIGLSSDGQVRRGLAVFRIERGGPTMIYPAPAPSLAAGM